MAKLNKIDQTAPTDSDRVTAELNLAIPAPLPEIKYPSGILVRGTLFLTPQENRLRTISGSTITWERAYAKLGMAADGRWPLKLPFHTPIPTVAGNSATLQNGQSLVLLWPYVARTGNDPRYLEESVLIECQDNEPTYPGLDIRWPNTVTGFTTQDVQDFLDETSWWLETRTGWTGRYGHPYTQMPSTGEPGYGGAMAVVTSFGAMLLCSNISDALKYQVQTRMLMMADDLEKFGTTYDADGGHGNGRFILWAIRKALRPTASSLFIATNFSENQQIYRNASNQIAWRFNAIGTVNANTPNYEYCCTINRWVGAAVCAKLATFLGYNTSDWVTYTIAYMTANQNNATAWYFSMSSRLATIFAANKVLIGY